MCKKCKTVKEKFKDYVYCPFCGSLLKQNYDAIIQKYTEDESEIEMIRMFLDMRIKKKKKPTNHALDLILKRLYQEWGLSKTQRLAVLEKSIVSNWTDVYCPEQLKKEGGLFSSETNYNDVYRL